MSKGRPPPVSAISRHSSAGSPSRAAAPVPAAPPPLCESHVAGMCAWTATRRPGFSPRRPAPRPRALPSRARRRSRRRFVSATACGRCRGVPRETPTSPPGRRLPPIVWSGLGSIIRRRTPSRTARQFLTPPYWESPNTSLYPRGIPDGISLKYGESFAPPGVAAAAHILPPRACTMCSFANCFTLMVPYVALCQSRYLDMPKPGGIGYIGAACRGVAGHPPIISCSMKSSVCDMRKRYHDLPYAPVEPAPLQVARMLGEVLHQSPIGQILLGFQDGHQVRPRRACPSRLWEGPAACAYGRLSLPSVRRSCAPRTCGPRRTWTSQCPDRSSCRRGCSCFGAGLACLSLAFCFLFMPAIRIGDQCAFRSSARAVLSVGIAGSFSFWARPRGLTHGTRSRTTRARPNSARRGTARGTRTAPCTGPVARVDHRPPSFFSTSMPPAPKILRGTLRPLRRFSLRVVVPMYLFN